MAAYGKGQMLGSGISPESFKQDYSGFSRAAEIQAQGLQNLGQSIGGAIQNFGEAKKEQKKVDAYNKASAKSIEAAITLGKSYEIKGVEETLAPFLESYNDPNLSPIEKAALLDEGKAMIPNVFGRFDKDQADAIQNAQITAAQDAATAKANNRPLTLAEIAMGQGKQQVMLDPVTGIAKPIVIQGFEDQSSQPSTLGNLPQPLQPYSKTFEEAGAKYGVAPQILAAIAMHETANGTSSAFRNKNNAMGVSDKSGPIAMASVEESIDKMASLLGKGINEGTGPYANAKTIDDIARVYAPPGAGNDPRNLNQFWTRGVSSNLQKLTQTNQAQEPQGRVGFTPNEVQAPTGTVITMDEYNAAVKSGQNIEGIPLPDGKFYATKQRPFAPQQGQEIITNDGTTIRSIALNGQGGLNKAPTTDLKEGEVLVADPTSPTGTKIVQVPSEAREKAKIDFTSYVEQMTGSYAKLDEMGKAVTGASSNPLNYIESTSAGQELSRMFGSEPQVLRDQINTMRPSIINVIRQASEMGAKGLDSEKELTFYLSALGDPKLPVEANIKALEVLDKVYGTGKAVPSMLKNYPELAKKVNSYKLALPKASNVAPTSGSSELYERYGVK
jgi:hypothetical protein